VRVLFPGRLLWGVVLDALGTWLLVAPFTIARLFLDGRRSL